MTVTLALQFSEKTCAKVLKLKLCCDLNAEGINKHFTLVLERFTLSPSFFLVRYESVAEITRAFYLFAGYVSFR